MRTLFQLVVNPVEENKRKDKCLACEYKIDKKGIDFCSKCGCFVSAKVKLQQTSCPEKKW